MKKIILIALFLQFSNSFAARIYGTVANNPENKGEITKGKFIKEFNTDEKGNFEVVFEVEKEGLYYLFFDKKSTAIYLTNNSNIEISFDLENNDQTINIKGIEFEATQYMFNRNKIYFSFYKDIKTLYSQNSENYLTSIENAISENKKILKNTNNLTPYFIALEEKNILYTEQNWLKNYEMYHEYYTKKSAKNIKKIDEKIIKNFDYNTDDWEFSREYVILINNQFSRDYYKQKDSKKIEFLKAEFQKTDSETMKQNFLNVASRTINSISNQNKILLDFLISESKDELFKEKMSNKYFRMGTYENGSIAPNFEYENTSGEKISLSSLLGKNVYLDFWATWCKPCVAEIPDLKKLEEKYKNENIVFLSISLDEQKNKEKWKKFIIDREIHGIQLLVDKAWSSKVVSDYVVEGIPKFVLIDKNGYIVEKNAPRPSDSRKLEKMIDQLLK